MKISSQEEYGLRCLLRLAQADQDFGASHGEAFSGSDVNGHAAPAPGVDVQFERGKGLYLGIRRNAR